MTQAVIEDAPVITRTPPPPLLHLFCSCQVDMPGGHRFAWCGVELSGRGRSMPAQTIDLCVLCQSIREEGIPCKFCGRVVGQ